MCPVHGRALSAPRFAGQEILARVRPTTRAKSLALWPRGSTHMVLGDVASAFSLRFGGVNMPRRPDSMRPASSSWGTSASKHLDIGSDWWYRLAHAPRRGWSPTGIRRHMANESEKKVPQPPTPHVPLGG